jgi:hypothetical protein
MVTQALDHLKSQRADGRVQGIGPQAARSPEIVLGCADGHAGKTVHHVAVRIIAEAGIEDELAALWVRRVPVAFGPAHVARSDMIEGRRQLMAQ